MGHAEINGSQLILHSHIITYGHAADEDITSCICSEIEAMWNEPQALVRLREKEFRLIFRITGSFQPAIQPEEIFANTDPRNNYFRIEEFALGNISFVDGLGCNTGYFKRDNLYEGSTTAAHEYGHTLGLKHPETIDIRGKGVPGIMYPRGTIVDPPYQYNPAAAAGDNTNGGTMSPRFRKVTKEEIALLKLHRFDWKNNQAMIGEFTSLWHPDHREMV